MKQRIETIDIVRGLTIFLVVIAHSSDNFFGDAIFKNFRMPLFFILSGYLFSYGKFEGNFFLLTFNKFNLLIIPYFTYAIIGLTIWTIRDLFILHNKLFLLDVGLGIFSGNGSNIKINTPIWFLTCLFFSTLFLYLTINFKKTSGKFPIIFLLVISITGVYINRYFILPWNIDVALAATLFMYVGYYLKEKNFLDKRNLPLKTFFLSVTLFLISNFFNGSIDMNERKYGNIFLFYISAFSGSYIIYWIIQKRIIKTNFLKNILIEIGKHSIVILGLHLPVILVIQKILLISFGYQMNFIISSIVAIVVCTILSKLIEFNSLLIYIFKGVKK